MTDDGPWELRTMDSRPWRYSFRGTKKKRIGGIRDQATRRQANWDEATKVDGEEITDIG